MSLTVEIGVKGARVSTTLIPSPISTISSSRSGNGKVQCSYRMPAPTSEELQYFGLQPGDRARTRDTECIICKENVQNPVVTACRHIYCFECIYQWFGRSTQCPECRQDLSPGAVVHEQTAPEWPTLSTRFSFSYSIPDDDSRTRLLSSTASSVIDLPKEDLESNDTSSTCARISGSFQHRLAPLSVQDPKCHRRQVPSYGSAAYLDEVVPPPEPTFFRQSLTAEDRAIAYIICHNGGNLPKTTQERDDAARRAGAILIDHERILDDMWQKSLLLSETVQVPLPCRAIAKCVWREWREFLKRQDGRWLLAEDLLEALSRSFELTVVEYGWVETYRDLPVDFVDFLSMTARAGSRID